MDDILVTKQVSENRTLCLSTLSRNQLATVPDYSGDHFGYFIYEMDHSRVDGGIMVLARVLSYDAAIRLWQFFGGSLSDDEATAH
jgi:hypothetical protein